MSCLSRVLALLILSFICFTVTAYKSDNTDNIDAQLHILKGILSESEYMVHARERKFQQNVMKQAEYALQRAREVGKNAYVHLKASAIFAQIIEQTPFIDASI